MEKIKVTLKGFQETLDGEDLVYVNYTDDRGVVNSVVYDSEKHTLSSEDMTQVMLHFSDYEYHDFRNSEKGAWDDKNKYNVQHKSLSICKG